MFPEVLRFMILNVHARLQAQDFHQKTKSDLEDLNFPSHCQHAPDNRSYGLSPINKCIYASESDFLKPARANMDSLLICFLLLSLSFNSSTPLCHSHQSSVKYQKMKYFTYRSALM